MTQTPLPSSAPPVAPASGVSRAPDAAPGPGAVGVPVKGAGGAGLPGKGRMNIAPGWLQVVLIAGLLGSAVFVGINGHILWCVLLVVAGGAFGLSFVLRRMVGDEYGRS